MTDWNAYFRMIINKIWIIIVITSVFVSIASYVSLFKIKPQYQASTRLFVLINRNADANKISYDDLMASQVLVKNYKELIKDRSITSGVIEKLNLVELTAEELSDRIDVELIPDSSMLSISVQYEEPELAANIANEISNLFILKMSELFKTNNISLVERAVVTEKPVFPRTHLIIASSFLAGIILSLGLILLLVYIDDTIGRLEEVEGKTGLPVVGIIPDMKKDRG